MLRQLRFYRVHSAWPGSEAALGEKLAERAFKGCPPYSERSFGFEPPVAEVDALSRRLSGADLVQLRLQSRVLPAAAVAEALEERLQEFVARTTREPSRKEKRDLKDEVISQLMPRTLLKSDRIRGFYVRDAKILALTVASATTCELFLDALRDALETLQVTPLEYQRPARTLMNQVFSKGNSGAFSLGSECRMQDPSDTKASVTWMDMDLHDRSAQAYAKGGLSIDRLGMTFDSMMHFTLDDELVLRKVRFEGIKELEVMDDDDPVARHDAEFALEVGATTRLLNALDKSLGGAPR